VIPSVHAHPALLGQLADLSRRDGTAVRPFLFFSFFFFLFPSFFFQFPIFIFSFQVFFIFSVSVFFLTFLLLGIFSFTMEQTCAYNIYKRIREQDRHTNTCITWCNNAYKTSRAKYNTQKRS